MSGSFSYASFSPTVGRPGGWGVGRKAGALEQMWINDIVPLIPTQLTDPVPLSNFPDRSDLARRLRRFSWLPAPWEGRDSADTGVFFASAPAGQDATGRPGNVFTFVHVGEPGSLPSHRAVQLLFSSSVPAPFGKRKVDDAALPDLGPEYSSATASPLTDQVIEAFLNGAPHDPDGSAELPPECDRVRAHTGPSTRRDILESLSCLVSSGQQAVLIADPVEGPLWVAALAGALPETLPDGRSFTWSTYERAAGVSEVLRLGTSLVVVPLSDRNRLPGDIVATIIDVAEVVPPVAPPAPELGTFGEAISGPVANPFQASEQTSVPTPVPTSVPAAAPSPVDPPVPSTPPARGSAPGSVLGSAPEPAPEQPPLAARIPTPNGTATIHPAIIRLTADDEDFIRNATLATWHITTCNLRPDAHAQAAEDYYRNWRHRHIDTYRNFLLLHPDSELGWTARIRVLALLSFGALPTTYERSTGLGTLNSWALTYLGSRTRSQLIEETVKYTVDHGYDIQTVTPPAWSEDPEVNSMAHEVARGRFNRRSEQAFLSPNAFRQYPTTDPGISGSGWRNF